MIWCFACGKKLSNKKYLVDTSDNQTVWVGPDCYKKVKKDKNGLKIDGFGGILKLLND